MAYEIFPPHNDVGTTASNGGVISEGSITGIFSAFSGRRTSYVISGLGLSSGASLVLSIASGSAYINGFRFSIDATITHTATASLTDSHLWIKLTRDGSSRVDGYEFVETAAATIPSPPDDDHVLLGEFSTSISKVTGHNENQRLGTPGVLSGSYTGDGDDSLRLIDLGVTPRFVIINSDEAVGRDLLIQLSNILVDYQDPGDASAQRLSISLGSPVGFGGEHPPIIAAGGFHVRDTATASDDTSNNDGVGYRYMAIV